MKRTIIVISLALLAGYSLSAKDEIRDTLNFDKAYCQTPASLLLGRISGVNVTPVDGNINGAVNTVIRGVNSLRTDSQPLWIVDGVIVNASMTDNSNAFWQFGEQSYTSVLNALSFINPYDIESIEVVKNLSAAAIYGSRGANGVVIIRTRTPRKEGFHVSWTSNFGINSVLQPMEGTASGLVHNHYVNLNGKTGNTVYSLSGSLCSTSGIFERNDNTSGSIRAIFETKANSVVWFGMNMAVSMSDMNSIAGMAYFGKPSMTMVMRDPSFFEGNTLAGWKEDFDDENSDKRATSSIHVTLNFPGNFKLKTTVGLDYQNDIRTIWYGNGTGFGLENNGAAAILSTTEFRYNAQSVLSWGRYFGKHQLVLSASAEAIGDLTKYNTQNGVDFYSHEMRGKGLSIAGGKFIHHKFDHEYNTVGLSGDLSYDWNGIAGVTATLRADNTSKYDDGNFTLYKAASVFGDLKKAFLPQDGFVSTLKLSAGYGQAGFERFVPYGMYGQYISGDYPYRDAGIEMYYDGLNRIFSGEINAGIDFGILQDRVLLHFGYYDKKSEDSFHSWCFGTKGEKFWEYAPRTEDFSISSIIANRGLEGEISADILRSGKIVWNVFSNVSYNVNQMLEVASSDAVGRPVGSGMIVNSNVKGYSVGMLDGFVNDGHGGFVDLTGDGKVNQYDRDCIGNPNPKFVWGAGTTLKLKDFTLDILANGAAGFDILNLNELLFDGGGVFEVSDKYIEKGDYARLARVSLGYTLRLPAVKQIESIKFSLSAFNLATLSSYSGWNPATNCFGVTALSSGVDYGSYPQARTFMLGVNVNF